VPELATGMVTVGAGILAVDPGALDVGAGALAASWLGPGAG
jgi:hypothetical protein